MRHVIFTLLLVLIFPQWAAAKEVRAGTNPRQWDIVLQIEGLPKTLPGLGYLEIDGFDSTPEQVAQIKARGTQAICYISAGTAEDFRPDFSKFKKMPNTVGKGFPGFEGDYFLNINHWREFFPLMERRIDMCKEKSFDYVDFDVIDSYDVDARETGFEGSEQNQIEYIVALTNKARQVGLKTIQKNAGELAPKLEPHFDGILFEECVRLDFCADAAPYIAAEKPAFNIEYPEEWPARKAIPQDICTISAKHGVMTILSTLDLDKPASHRCP